MKITIAWNVWDNYEDVLLGSEIARRCNDESRLFELRLISQGGFPVPPSPEEAQYLDCHLSVTYDKSNLILNAHVKYAGVLRVLGGVRQAFEYGRANNSDFVIITNADAWLLDLHKLHSLLSRSDVGSAAIAARVGPATGLNLNYGACAPFFDDHFIILNVPLCERYSVFTHANPKYFRSHFPLYGGIHYALIALMDECVPPGKFLAYTDLRDCVNHYGENSGFSLLPWQFQPSYAFLHANCFQEPLLHALRAENLRFRGLDRFPKVREYCNRHPGHDRDFRRKAGYVVFRKPFEPRVRMAALQRRIVDSVRRRIGYPKVAELNRRLGGYERNSLVFFDSYKHVLTMDIATRRPADRPTVGPGARRGEGQQSQGDAKAS